jgi:hypothetical protein
MPVGAPYGWPAERRVRFKSSQSLHSLRRPPFVVRPLVAPLPWV